MHEDSSSCVMNIVQATVDGLGVGECGPWPLPLQGKAHSKVPFQGPRLIEFSKILAKLLHDPAEQNSLFSPCSVDSSAGGATNAQNL